MRSPSKARLPCSAQKHGAWYDGLGSEGEGKSKASPPWGLPCLELGNFHQRRSVDHLEELGKNRWQWGSRTPKQRVLDLSQPEPNSGCWIWLGSVAWNKSGMAYGKIRLNALKKGLAHRFSWMAFHGRIPKGKFVLHKCDVTLCVNPLHLFLGNHRENMADMVFKGRQRNKAVQK